MEFRNYSNRPDQRSSLNSEREPTTVQQSAADLSFCLDALSILKKHAKIYARVQSQNLDRRTNQDFGKKDLYIRIKTGLTDYFFIKETNNEDALLNFQNQWGEEAHVISSLFDQVATHLNSKKEEHTQRASSLSRLDIMRLTLRVSKKLATFTPDEQRYLLQKIGYEKIAVEDTMKHLATAGALSGGITTANYFVSTAVVAKELVDPLLGNISDPHTQLLLLMSYALRYATLGIIAQQNYHLLERYETNSNLLTTTMYLLLQKLYPDHKSLINLAVILSTIGPTIVQDALSAGILTTSIGPSIIAAKNLVTSALRSVVIGGGEIALRRKGSQNNDESN